MAEHTDKVEYVRYVKEDSTVEDAEVRTLGINPGTGHRTKRRVIGDSPQHGKHLLWDSDSNTLSVLEGGLAFALGVACMEASLTANEGRLYRVMHPNQVVLYDVKYHQGYVMVRKAD
jgi:hypothetical protein